MKIYHWPKTDGVGNKIFQELLQKKEKQLFDDSYLEQVIAYEQMYKDTEKFSVFFAAYALANGNVQVALDTLKEGERKRRICPAIWELLVETYTRMGEMCNAAYYQALLRRFCQKVMSISIPFEEKEHYLSIFTIAATQGTYAPYMWKATLLEKGVDWHFGFVIGDFLYQINRHEEWKYWVGAYLPSGNLNHHAWLLAQYTDNLEFAQRTGVDAMFDIQRAKAATCFNFEVKPGDSWVLPVAGTEEQQRIEFEFSKQTKPVHAGKWTFSYYRLEQPVTISSTYPFAVGKPIRLAHSRKRRKLVLNILVDALSWGEMKARNFQDVPHLMNFFRKGIIFNNQYSVAEYTYPSFSAIETGMYLHHNQIFNELFGQPVDESYRTISEQIQSLGYYCTSVMGNGGNIYNCTNNGFDRLIVTPPSLMRAYDAVERAIRQIEAFAECDQCVFLHVLDAHTYSARTDAPPLQTQTHLPLEERVMGAEDQETSVNLKPRDIYIKGNLQGIRDADRALGNLFQYLEEHFAEDEYIVHLFSDHGVPVYEKLPYLTSEKQSNAALMMRGGDIPMLGLVNELVSGVDIYPIMAHNIGFPVGEHVDGVLPEVLGGPGRRYVFTNSLYPGKNYCLGIRDENYEFRMESKHIVGMDGTVDLSESQMTIWQRNPEHKNVENEDVFYRFYEQAQEFTKKINNFGDIWPDIKNR